MSRRAGRVSPPGSNPPISEFRALTLASRRRTIELAAAVKNTFEPVLLLHLYPRSSIDIYLQILENDGCEFRRSLVS